MKNLPFCSKCGLMLDEDDRFCSSCGASVSKTVEEEMSVLA